MSLSLAVTMSEEYPRVTVLRGTKRRGVRYFGPYSHAWAIRETVDTLTNDPIIVHGNSLGGNTAMHMAAGYAMVTGRGQAVLVHVDAG